MTTTKDEARESGTVPNTGNALPLAGLVPYSLLVDGTEQILAGGCNRCG